MAVAGQEPDGVGVGLDGPGALVLRLQDAPEAPVEDQKVTVLTWRTLMPLAPSFIAG